MKRILDRTDFPGDRDWRVVCVFSNMFFPPRLSLLLPKDGNSLPDPLNDPPPPLPVLQLHLVAAASSSEADEYSTGDYVEALNYMDFQVWL
jgi:hypothetical protein